MKAGTFAIELAEYRVAEERDVGVAKVQDAVAALGTKACKICETEIDIERRRAAPFATRCIDCQTKFERLRRRA